MAWANGDAVTKYLLEPLGMAERRGLNVLKARVRPASIWADHGTMWGENRQRSGKGALPLIGEVSKLEARGVRLALVKLRSGRSLVLPALWKLHCLGKLDSEGEEMA